MDHLLEKSLLQGRKFSRRVVRWLVIVRPILASVVTLMFSSITLLFKSEGWMAHSYQVLDALDLTEAHYTDGNRQNAAMPQPVSRQCFALSPRSAADFSNVASLRRLTEDNPLQQGRAIGLSKAISGELERMSVVTTITAAGYQLEAETWATAASATEKSSMIVLSIDELEISLPSHHYIPKAVHHKQIAVERQPSEISGRQPAIFGCLCPTILFHSHRTANPYLAAFFRV